MPRDLFGDVTDPSVKVGSRKWYTVPVSLALHTVAVLIVFIVPLMATGALPVPHDAVIFVPVALAPLPAPPPVHRADAPKPAVNNHAAPIETPETIAKEPEFEIEVANPAASGLHEMGIVEGGTALMAAHRLPPGSTHRFVLVEISSHPKRFAMSLRSIRRLRKRLVRREL